MPRPCIFAWLICLIGFASALASEAKHPEWTSEDSVVATRFVQAVASHPETIDSLVKGSLDRIHDLGFDYRLREVWINPAGKLGFSAKIIYSGSKIMGFELKPVLNYQGLQDHYLKLLIPFFHLRPNTKNKINIAPYYWKRSETALILPADMFPEKMDDTVLSVNVRESLAFYMTPYSGILYGIRGGENLQILENRDAFLEITEMLMADRRLSRYLLRSLNPASRLTAAEFIIRHHQEFPDYENLNRFVFSVLFEQPKKLKTFRGRKEVFEEARKITFENASLEVKRDNLGILRMY
jgi:hypothetical protein